MNNRVSIHNPQSNSKPVEHDTVNTLSNLLVKMSKEVVAAAGFNVQAPVVNAIIGNLTGTLPTKKSKLTEAVKCEICDCEVSSNVVLSFHINGSKHKKRLKALNIIAQLKEGNEKGILLGNGNSPNDFRCEVCALTVNSAQQLEVHLSGAKHKKKAVKAAETGTESPDNFPVAPAAKKRKIVEPKVLSCDICNVFMNSQIQYDQHLSSKKHLLKSKSQNGGVRSGELKKVTQFKSGGIQYPDSVFDCIPFNLNNLMEGIVTRSFSQT